MNFLSFLFRSEKFGQFCQHQIYARKTAEGVYRCHPEDDGAQLFCLTRKNDGGGPVPCPYNSKEIYKQEEIYRIAHNRGGQLEDVCDKFYSHKHFQSDKAKSHR